MLSIPINITQLRINFNKYLMYEAVSDTLPHVNQHESHVTRKLPNYSTKLPLKVPVRFGELLHFSTWQQQQHLSSAGKVVLQG